MYIHHSIFLFDPPNRSLPKATIVRFEALNHLTKKKLKGISRDEIAFPEAAHFSGFTTGMKGLMALNPNPPIRIDCNFEKNRLQ